MLKRPINKFCPRSGKYIREDSLTIYRGNTVGFYNSHCCQEFAANPDAYPSDRAYFDTLLKEYELATEVD